MKAYGYQKNNDDLLKLEEVSFECDIEEIDEIIKFFQYVKEEHSKVRLETEFCHSHLRDWKESWSNESTDIIVVTNFNSSNID